MRDATRVNRRRGSDGALRSLICVCAIAIALILTSCSSTPANKGATYTVKRGDTLYAIATRYGLDYRELARLNGIGRDYTIHAGQVLRLNTAARVPAATARAQRPPPKGVTPVLPPAPPIPWQWPVEGGLAKLTERPNGGHGLTISGQLGQDVRAASGGRIVYLGSGLLGYGQLLIIKHSDAYLSAYGHTQTVSVKEGDIVAMGQRIASMGAGPQGTPMLYFEVRANGVPANPLLFLPRR